MKWRGVTQYRYNGTLFDKTSEYSNLEHCHSSALSEDVRCLHRQVHFNWGGRIRRFVSSSLVYLCKLRQGGTMGVRLVSEWKGSLQLVYVLFGAEVGPSWYFHCFKFIFIFFLSLNINYRCSFRVSTFGSDNTSSVWLWRLFKQVVDDASTLSSLRMHSHKCSLPWLPS